MKGQLKSNDSSLDTLIRLDSTRPVLFQLRIQKMSEQDIKVLLIMISLVESILSIGPMWMWTMVSVHSSDIQSLISIRR